MASDKRAERALVCRRKSPERLFDGGAGRQYFHHQLFGRTWHRKSASTIGGKARNLMKYNYYRTVPPKRDWIVEPEFDFATAKYGNGPSHPLRRQTRDTVFGSEMMFWLSGLSDSYYAMGGQNWPHTNKDAKFVDTPYGYPLTPERERFPRPDWAEDGAGIPDGSRSR